MTDAFASLGLALEPDNQDAPCWAALTMDEHSDPEPCTDSESGSGRFDLRLAGQHVVLLLAGVSSEQRPTAGEVFAALNDLPVDRVLSAAVFRAIRELPGDPVTVAELDFPEGAEWTVKVAPSGMAVYVVPGPGGESDDAIRPAEEEVRAELDRLRVTHGLLDATLRRLPDGIESPVRVAEGWPPVPGRDASVEFMFETNPSAAPVPREDGSVDYHNVAVQRSVESGTVLARRLPPVRGQNGYDIFGRDLPAPPVRDKALIKQQGKGTVVDGDDLVATRPGRPVIVNERVEVLPIYEVRGDVDFSVGNIDFVGDVVVHGDVRPGFAIRAGGSVTIFGIVDHATITAAADISARGITGDESCQVQAGKDLLSHYLHNVRAIAGGTVKVQREILNSSVAAARIEVVGGGRIVGGRLAAKQEVTAGTIGSVQATATYVEISPGTPSSEGVIRATSRVFFGTTLDVAHAVLQVNEDLPASSFWAVNGEVARLDAFSSRPA